MKKVLLIIMTVLIYAYIFYCKSIICEYSEILEQQSSNKKVLSFRDKRLFRTAPTCKYKYF